MPKIIHGSNILQYRGPFVGNETTQGKMPTCVSTIPTAWSEAAPASNSKSGGAEQVGAGG